MVWNYQNADCSLQKNFIVSFIIIFGILSSLCLITGRFVMKHSFAAVPNANNIYRSTAFYINFCKSGLQEKTSTSKLFKLKKQDKELLLFRNISIFHTIQNTGCANKNWSTLERYIFCNFWHMKETKISQQSYSTSNQTVFCAHCTFTAAISCKLVMVFLLTI